MTQLQQLIGAAIAAVSTTGIGLLFRRFKRSAAYDLDDSFTRYLRRGIWFRIRARLQAPASRALSLRRYCEHTFGQVDSHVTVPVPGDRPLPIPIDQAYVELTLDTQSDLVAGSDLLHLATRRTLLIGDPGSGKSTLLKWVFRTANRHAYRDPIRAPMPIHIELKTIDWLALEQPDATPDLSLPPPLISHIRARLGGLQGIYDPVDLFDRSVDSAGVLLLLDGLDEVRSTQLDNALQAIEALARWLAGNRRSRIIVTSRSQLVGTLTPAFLELFDSSAEIRPLQSHEIRQFIIAWPYRGAYSPPRAKAIFDSIQDQPSLADMCTNPLILAMYTAYCDRILQGTPSLDTSRIVKKWADRTVPPSLHRVPTSRPAFYRLVLDELLVYRRHEQLDIEADPETILRSRRRLLADLALDHVRRIDQPMNDLSWDAALTYMSDHYGLEEAAATIQLRDIAVQTGLITEARRAESFVFMHRTFCEYFAGLAAMEAGPDEWSRLVALSHELAAGDAERTRLWEVMTFAVALMPQFMQDEAIQAVAELDAPSLLLQCIRESRRYDMPLYGDAVTLVVQQISSHRSVASRAEIRRLGLTVAEAEKAALVSGDACQIATRDMWLNLARESENGFGDYLGVALEIDWRLAFEIADSEGVSLVPDHIPDVLSLLSVQPALEFFIERASRGEDPLSRLVLLEASITFASVSEALAANGSWSGEASGGRVSRRDRAVNRARRLAFRRVGAAHNACAIEGLWIWYLSQGISAHRELVEHANLVALQISGPSLKSLTDRYNLRAELARWLVRRDPHWLTRLRQVLLRLSIAVAVFASLTGHASARIALGLAILACACAHIMLRFAWVGARSKYADELDVLPAKTSLRRQMAHLMYPAVLDIFSPISTVIVLDVAGTARVAVSPRFEDEILAIDRVVPAVWRAFESDSGNSGFSMTQGGEVEPRRGSYRPLRTRLDRLRRLPRELLISPAGPSNNSTDFFALDLRAMSEVDQSVFLAGNVRGFTLIDVDRNWSAF